MSNHPQDMKPVLSNPLKVQIETGYGHIEVVNMKVAEYIWRLRQIIKDANLSENPRHNKVA
jgi:hypothetical protein